jgi:3-hydroxybutyryl-CoA dehydrogenase
MKSLEESECGSVVVIGGGIMGCDVAAIFIASGWTVQVVETDPRARETLARRVLEAATQIAAHASSDRLAVLATQQGIRWVDVAIVIECAPEDLEIKREVFACLDREAPAGVPLTSNSSGFPISLIGEGLAGIDRMLGLHFFMPAHLVPAVEVVRSAYSDEAIVQTVSAIMRSVGKRPVLVKRDVPGFLANRIQHALMREAIALVEEGFASPEDVDIAVRYGFGFRYIAAGPLLQKDLAGIDIHCAAAATMYPHLNRATEPSRLMRELVTAGNCGVKSPSRRGFYDWDEASIAREQKRYQRALLKAMEILRDEEREEV